MADKGNILVVDDTLASLKLLDQILKGEGFDVRCANSGELALRSAFSNPPDLVLLDILMPQMDGFEVCRRLKAHPSTAGVSVIFLSALNETEEKVQGFRLGAVDFVNKPFQREEMLARVKTHLEVDRLRHRLEEMVEERTRRLSESEAQLKASLAESLTTNAHLRTLVHAIPDLVWVKDPQGVYLRCNLQFERFYGAKEAEIVGKTDYDFTDKGLADRFRDSDRRAMAVGKPVTSESWLTFAEDGSQGLFETVKTPMWDATGQLIGVLGIARDITERKRTEEQLRIAATAFEAQEGILIATAEKTILRVNSAFSAITGYGAEDAVGRTLELLQPDDGSAAFLDALWQRVNRDGAWQGEIGSRRKNGESFPLWLNVSAVKDDERRTTHYVAMMLDITERKAAEREIEQLAFYDSLTGLPNRRLLMDRLQQTMSDSLRHQRKPALLFIDLDNFKMLNDTSGHDAGDRLLVEVAQRLSACVRDGDTVARLGGDEYVVMLKDLNEHSGEAAAQAKTIGEKILTSLSRPYLIDGREHHSTPSIGVTLFMDAANSVEDLLKQADIAMYQAKAAGRNTLRFFDPTMQTALAARADMETALREGIERHQFVLHYQVQVDNRGMIGAEALLRWQHPQLGMVSPTRFIPLAEETGLILPIGHWVLDSACKQLQAWAANSRTRHLSLSINVSARQFRQPDFVDQVRAALEMSGAPAERLKIELTESLVLDNLPDTVDKMKALKRLGVGCSMDDFGTGYSSLSYLARLPIDQVKIDQSFVRNLPDSTSDAAVAQTIIALARHLGLSVIAEGVETETQRQFLGNHECPTYQGYLFSQPVPLAEFEQLVAA